VWTGVFINHDPATKEGMGTRNIDIKEGFRWTPGEERNASPRRLANEKESNPVRTDRREVFRCVWRERVNRDQGVPIAT